jgi:predicted SAM-dependent methyltransferase
MNAKFLRSLVRKKKEMDMKLTPRAQMITAHLDLIGRGVEYGPLHRRLIPKPSYDVLYVDYADREFLVEHYKNNPNVDINLIPEIDIVTGGKSLSEFLAEKSIDYVVASHVMEHVPDLLGWLEANLKLLKVGGKIAVAFPDKRYCFDIKRRTTFASDILCAHLEKRTRPTFQQICDHFWNVSKVTPVSAWDGTVNAQNAEHVHSRKQAFDIMRAKVHSEEYTDCHCWIFEDHQFVKVMNEIRPYSSIGFEITSFHPTQFNTLEFYVIFERVDR